MHQGSIHKVHQGLIRCLKRLHLTRSCLQTPAGPCCHNNLRKELRMVQTPLGIFFLKELSSYERKEKSLLPTCPPSRFPTLTVVPTTTHTTTTTTTSFLVLSLTTIYDYAKT